MIFMNPVDKLLQEIFGRRKKKYEEEIEKDYGHGFIKVITEKERKKIDYSHKVIICEKDFINIFRYIKSLKKQIAKLKSLIQDK